MKKSTNASIQIYKRLLVYVKPYRGLFAISIFGFSIYSGTQSALVVLIRHIVDTLQTQTREGMFYLPMFFSGVFIVQGIGTYLGNYFLAKVSTNVVHALRCQIFDKYTELPTAFFDANNSGYLISRITNNVGEMTKASTDAIRTFVREGLTVLGLLCYLFYSNWMLSLVFVGITPIIVVLVKYVSKRLRKISRRIQDSIGDITHITSELVTGHRIVRGYGGEAYERRRFLESSLYNRQQSLKLATTTAIHNPIMQFIIAIALSFLMYMALIFMKQASVGEFIAYLMAAILLQRPIRQLSDANSDIQKGIAAAQTIFEILDVPSEVDEGTYRIEKAKGALEFKN
ncbi:MAG: lipid ABC transporter permease/ATP-binding protein, partial [Methyloglobulus sp.]|nr:lipid ABC transporter permease/ATP-binding protein [Methyloglobulus sp.]